MTKVSVSAKLPATAEQVWKLVGGWNALPEWHPGVAGSVVESNGADRRLQLAGGGELVETLVQRDDGARTYSYVIRSGPLPVADYKASIRVSDTGDGGSRVEWSSRFEPSGVSETDATATIEGIYQAGLDNLKKLFGG